MNKPRRPRLDRRVRDGLRSLAANADAGGPEDIGLHPSDQESWENVERAIAWVASLPSDEESGE